MPASAATRASVAASKPCSEPLLKARAEELSPGRIRFGHELTGLEQDAEGVRATVRDHASGRQYAVRCQYLLGADGAGGCAWIDDEDGRRAGRAPAEVGNTRSVRT
jgi:FAD binding domain